jgi:hypothetical protein
MIPSRRFLAIAFAVSVILPGCSEGDPTGPDAGGVGNPPPPLVVSLRTDDPADLISVSSQAVNSGSVVRVCLSVSTASGWWKGVGVNATDPTMEGDRAAGDQCANFTPGNMTLTFWKAKGLGVHSNVGSRSLDLSRYAGHTVSLTWVAD